MYKKTRGRLNEKSGLSWGKGTKRLVRRVEELGYKLEYKNGELIMTFMGACPPYDKKIRPVLQAISDNTDAIIEHLKYLEARKILRKGDEESEFVQENEISPAAQCAEHDRRPKENSNEGNKNGPSRYFGFFKRRKHTTH